jgi:membrane protein
MTRASAPPHAFHSVLKSWADEQNTNASFGQKLLRFVVRLILITTAEFANNALSLRAAALTYTVLLSLVPILALSTALMKGLGGDDQLRRAAYSYIATLTHSNSDTYALSQLKVPDSPDESMARPKGGNLTDHLHSAVDQLFLYVDKTNFTTLGSIGVAGILLSVILVLSFIEEAMNVIWKAPGSRSLLRKVADYLTLLVLLPVSINFAFAAGALLQSPTLANKIDILIPFAWLQTLLLKAMPLAIITLSFYAIYVFFPNTKVKNLPAFIGAGLAALLWTLAQDIYITLQIGVANYNAIYGSFASLPLFLLWIYLGWLFILAGAQVAYAWQNMQSYRLLPLAAVPSLELGAAFDIIDCIASAFAEAKPMNSHNLLESLPQYDCTMIAEVMAKLQRGGLIHVSQSDNRLLPASPEEAKDYQKAVAIILGTDTVKTCGGARSLNAMAAAEASVAKAAPSLPFSITPGA